MFILGFRICKKSSLLVYYLIQLIYMRLTRIIKKYLLIETSFKTSRNSFDENSLFQNFECTGNLISLFLFRFENKKISISFSLIQKELKKSLIKHLYIFFTLTLKASLLKKQLKVFFVMMSK